MQWIELEQPLGAGDGSVALASGRTLEAELLIRRNRQGAQSFAFEQRPLLKGRAAVQVKAIEEIACVTRGGGSKLSPSQVGFESRNVRSILAAGLSVTLWRLTSR